MRETCGRDIGRRLRHRGKRGACKMRSGVGVAVAVAVAALLLVAKAGLFAISGGGRSQDQSIAAMGGNPMVVQEWWSDWLRLESYDQSWPKFKFSWTLVLGTLIGIFGSALGSVGGVGGGGFYLPMLNVILGFDAKTSAALSKGMVMGASASSVAFNLKEKHPTECRPVIDYEIALLFQPMILLGISIGVILNVTLPEWLVTFLLVILFSKLASSAFKRASRLAELERTNQDKEECEESHIEDFVEAPAEDGEACVASDASEQEKESWKWFNWENMAVLILTWLVFVAIQIFKVYVPDCGLWYWLATALQVPVAFGVTLREALRKPKSANPDSSETEPLVSNSRTDTSRSGARKFMISLLGLASGVVGGLLGVGGGGIMGPGFLELGYSPQVTSATSCFIMVFSSSLSVAEFFLLGRLPTDFAIYLTLVAAASSAIGQAIIKKLIIATGKTSIIIYILVGCLSSAALLLGILGFDRSYRQWEAGVSMGFQELCASE